MTQGGRTTATQPLLPHGGDWQQQQQQRDGGDGSEWDGGGNGGGQGVSGSLVQSWSSKGLSHNGEFFCVLSPSQGSIYSGERRLRRGVPVLYGYMFYVYCCIIRVPGTEVLVLRTAVLGLPVPPRSAEFTDFDSPGKKNILLYMCPLFVLHSCQVWFSWPATVHHILLYCSTSKYNLYISCNTTLALLQTPFT